MKKELIVGVSSFEPLVISSNNKFSGFEIDLWEIIANKLNLKFTYKELDFKKLLPAIKNKKIDVAFSGITRTKQREELVSFSYFTLRSGLAILINEDSKISFLGTLKGLFLNNSRKVLKFLSIFIGFIFLISNVFWYFEKNLPTIDIDTSYWAGIVDSLWWTVILMSGVGGTYPDSSTGKAIGFFVVFFGITIFAIFIARITSFITFNKLKYVINNPKDLKNKRVGTKKDTTSLDELNKLGAKVISEEKIEDAFKKLEHRKIEAVVFDEPVIKNFVNNQQDDNFVIVGDVFNKQTYGLAFPHDSDLREKFNKELLGLFESGEYDLLYNKWFGNK